MKNKKHQVTAAADPGDQPPHGLPEPVWNRLTDRLGFRQAALSARATTAVLSGWLCWDEDGIASMSPENFERAVLAHAELASPSDEEASS